MHETIEVQGISDLFDKLHRPLFLSETLTKQFQPNDRIWPSSDANFANLTGITKLGDALTSLEVIIEQGEGAPQGTKSSHYNFFYQLWQDTQNHPLDCYPVVGNINLEDYTKEKFYPVRPYCWLAVLGLSQHPGYPLTHDLGTLRLCWHLTPITRTCLPRSKCSGSTTATSDSV